MAKKKKAAEAARIASEKKAAGDAGSEPGPAVATEPDERNSYVPLKPSLGQRQNSFAQITTLSCDLISC